ncbi:MAG: hypothetical protein JWR80_3764 [Bradyrhizobium sp.]|nr:hypothetical protein [Bradyrhizobium sp.]
MSQDISLQQVLSFSGHRQLAVAGLAADLTEESQAALRQLSLERLMAYGVHHADAMELRGRVQAGEQWQAVATDLAAKLTAPVVVIAAETGASRINRLFRASALLRMSQMMMFTDSAERRDIFAEAARLFGEAADLAGDRQRMMIECQDAPLVGWLYPAEKAIGQVIVIGGIEGWAMDFAEMGCQLSRRGMDTLLLDGPGQGESRLAHHHRLDANWEQGYSCVLAALQRRSSLPIGIVGNSMGGAVAVHLAARDARIQACCGNGGSSDPGRQRPLNSFFRKMMAHAGANTPEEAYAVWGTIDPVAAAFPVSCPLLIVQGGEDPVVSMEHAQRIHDAAASPDKRIVVFSDGDHCIYNHSDDKHAVIGDWMASRLVAAG